jgi:hypothetical protein
MLPTGVNQARIEFLEPHTLFEEGKLFEWWAFPADG